MRWKGRSRGRDRARGPRRHPQRRAVQRRSTETQYRDARTETRLRLRLRLGTDGLRDESNDPIPPPFSHCSLSPSVSSYPLSRSLSLHSPISAHSPPPPHTLPHSGIFSSPSMTLDDENDNCLLSLSLSSSVCLDFDSHRPSSSVSRIPSFLATDCPIPPSSLDPGSRPTFAPPSGNPIWIPTHSRFWPT